MSNVVFQLVEEDFEESRLHDKMLSPQTTHLSPYLRFGCLSSRLMFHRMREEYRQVWFLAVVVVVHICLGVVWGWEMWG